MKPETFFKAVELNDNINDIAAAISYAEKGKGPNNLDILNLGTFSNGVEDEAIRTVLLTYLKKRLKKLQAEFDNLK
jgi:hypothetical protein